MQYLVRFDALKRDLKLLWGVVFCMMFGFGVYSAVFYNFATESLRIQPDQLGMVEAVREAPGLICVLIAALTIRMAEPVLGSFALVISALSMCAYAYVRNVPSLMAFSFFWSIGFHAWMPLQSSMVLGLTKDTNRGKRLGQTACVGGLGTVAGMLLVRLINHGLSYSTWFVVGGAWMLLAAIIMCAVKRNIGQENRPRFVWKKQYSLYYALSLLEGGRRQVFSTFAIYALTREYHTPLKTVALLMLINAVVSIFGNPIVGRMIDRIGERRILIASYIAVVFVFIGYATIHKAGILFVLYCLDNVLFLSTTCLTTYLHRIADPADLTATLFSGVTMGHIAAVIVPLIGGFLWQSLGYPVTFFGGAGLVIISIVLAMSMPRHKLQAHL